ncbi:MAG: efflux RND transporter periplasmic adaptor subunit, partial [Bacteroidales bacterium]|nr:efflux RND transporter periplasmic adaptor subunit [Bacteroidales bacterium]
RKETQNITFETVNVTRGTVSNSITATGTIQAVKTVEVGTQVSGEISKIYIDYNSTVKAGQLLAELDRKPLVTALTIAEASLDNAKAEITYQTANYNRTKALFEKKLVAESDFDLVLYNFEKAKATLKTAQLNYDKAKINLDYAFIYSPIDGVVLDRAVSEGQTVAASFSTPTLFTIARDLTQMQVEASVDEADIGQVKEGQRVSFTVDAYPDLEFSGEVIQIRLQPVITSNVVTYTVIVKAANTDLKLMPGMTATITVYVEEAENVIVVASKALRFKPDNDVLLAYIKNLPKDGQSFSGKDIPGAQTSSSPFPDNPAMDNQKKFIDKVNANQEYSEVWVKSDNTIHPVRINTGIDNDINVEILSGLKVGDEVVVAMSSSDNKSGVKQQNASSPFMPKPPSRKKD